MLRGHRCQRGGEGVKIEGVGSEKPLESVPGCKKDGSALFSESMKLGLRASFDGQGDFFRSTTTLPPTVNPFPTAENECMVKK